MTVRIYFFFIPNSSLYFSIELIYKNFPPKKKNTTSLNKSHFLFSHPIVCLKNEAYAFPTFVVGTCNGQLVGCCSGAIPTVRNVFYVTGSAFGSGTCFNGQTSYSSATTLQSAVNSSFSQCVWDGHRLRSEYNYNSTSPFFFNFTQKTSPLF